MGDALTSCLIGLDTPFWERGVMGRAFTLITPLLLVVGCGRSPVEPRPSSVDAADSNEISDATAAPQSESDARGSTPDTLYSTESTDAAVEPSTKIRGLEGQLVNLPRGKRGRVLVFRAGEKQPRWSGRVDGEGRFALPELEPGAYRVIVPADGLHGTADTLAFVTADLGALVAIHRPAGCKIRMLFRDEAGEPLSGARVELSLPDLDQVSERLNLEERSDERGRVIVKGSCVNGKIRGVVHTPGRSPFEWEQRTVGNGNDRFAIQLPSRSDAGLAPGAAER